MNPPHSPGAALREAASLGDAALCQRLLGSARGCVRYSRDGLGRSALHLASAGGHAAALRILLDAAAPGEVDRPDGEGCAPLQRAASDGQEECERLLLSRGADVDKRDAVHGNTALHEAAWKGYSRSVRLLAMAGATLDLSNGGGFTALHLCCQNGHNQTCRELLLAGCNPDIQNSYGDTSLHTAARYGHAGVTRILLSANCQVSVANKNGDTALHIASAMGRRKLTRILMEAGCERGVRNQQGETARDIAARKGLAEIVGILDRAGGVKGKGRKGRGKSKVRFEPDVDVGTLPTIIGTPYGCHYSPSPSSFPPPRLDTLPSAPLRRGEQYYLDLAGRIRKGPVGVGAACRCAPLLKQLEARLSREGRELRAAQAGLGARVRGLEERLARTGRGRRSERTTRRRETCLVRSRSLEAVDEVEDGALQASRSMDELDPPGTQSSQRQSVKEIVAKFQQQTYHNGENSESSDDEDNPLRICKIRGPMGDSNLSTNPFPIPNYENIPNDSPRSRSGVYNPTIINTALVQPTTLHLDSGKPQDSDIKVFNSEGYVRFTTQPSQKRDQDLRYNQSLHSPQQHKDLMGYDVNYNRAFESSRNENNRVVELNSRFAKLRVLEGTRSALEGTSRMLDTNKMFDSTVRMLETPQDTGDRDTNNDSGYSTKVYGSSKGNSPSLSGGQVEGECVGAASLV